MHTTAVEDFQQRGLRIDDIDNVRRKPRSTPRK
jgi:hypothetical protein